MYHFAAHLPSPHSAQVMVSLRDKLDSHVDALQRYKIDKQSETQLNVMALYLQNQQTGRANILLKLDKVIRWEGKDAFRRS